MYHFGVPACAQQSDTILNGQAGNLQGTCLTRTHTGTRLFITGKARCKRQGAIAAHLEAMAQPITRFLEAFCTITQQLDPAGRAFMCGIRWQWRHKSN
jgi:hypothetical protein